MHSIIRIKEVLKRLNISRSTVWRLESQGKFIPKVQISPRTVGYLEADLEEYLKRRITSESNNQPSNS